MNTLADPIATLEACYKGIISQAEATKIMDKRHGFYGGFSDMGNGKLHFVGFNYDTQRWLDY